MRESKVIGIIESQLKQIQHYYINVHGSIYSKSGTPDILTLDNQGFFTGIEAKVSGKSPIINQARRCKEIIESGGRFIVAYEDFDAVDYINHEMHLIEFERENFNEMSIFDEMSKHKDSSYEVVMND